MVLLNLVISHIQEKQLPRIFLMSFEDFTIEQLINLFISCRISHKNHIALLIKGERV